MVVEVEEGQVVVVVVVVECRGRMVPISVIGSAGTATVIILVAVYRVGEVSGVCWNYQVTWTSNVFIVPYLLSFGSCKLSQ